MEARARASTSSCRTRSGASYLQATTELQYDVARRSWIGDYLDPNTFLDMWRAGDGNNRTGWSNPRYDALIARAGRTLDEPAKRLRSAGARPRRIAARRGAGDPRSTTTPPSSWCKPYVRGIYPTPLDIHPLTHVWIDRGGRRGAGADPSAGGGAAPLTTFLLRRLLLMIPTLWAIATLTFFLMRAGAGRAVPVRARDPGRGQGAAASASTGSTSRSSSSTCASSATRRASTSGRRTSSRRAGARDHRSRRFPVSLELGRLGAAARAR